MDCFLTSSEQYFSYFRTRTTIYKIYIETRPAMAATFHSHSHSDFSLPLEKHRHEQCNIFHRIKYFDSFSKTTKEVVTTQGVEHSLNMSPTIIHGHDFCILTSREELSTSIDGFYMYMNILLVSWVRHRLSIRVLQLSVTIADNCTVRQHIDVN